MWYSGVDGLKLKIICARGLCKFDVICLGSVCCAMVCIRLSTWCLVDCSVRKPYCWFSICCFDAFLEPVLNCYLCNIGKGVKEIDRSMILIFDWFGNGDDYGFRDFQVED